MTSFDRCGRCLAKTIVDLKRNLLLGIIAYLGFWMVMGLLMGLFVIGGGSGEIGLYSVVGLLTCNAMAAGIFGDMKTKEGRINVLMQPASTAEKFWARLFLAFIGPIIVVNVGFFVLEFARLIGTAIMTKEWVHMLYPWHLLGINSIFDLLVFITGFLAIQSYYFFGGILWPKASFLKSFSVLIVIELIGITLFLYIVKNCKGIMLIDFSNTVIYCALLTFNIALGLLLAFLAYRRLKYSTITYGLRQ